MGYSIDPISDHCYPGTSILINKFDIRDEGKLNEVESVVVSARYAEWLNEPKETFFDFAHYKAIHHFLFSDLYDWAGEVRTVDISKKGTRFTPAEQIGCQAEQIFRRLRGRDQINQKTAGSGVSAACCFIQISPYGCRSRPPRHPDCRNTPGFPRKNPRRCSNPLRRRGRWCRVLGVRNCRKGSSRNR